MKKLAWINRFFFLNFFFRQVSEKKLRQRLISMHLEYYWNMFNVKGILETMQNYFKDCRMHLNTINLNYLTFCSWIISSIWKNQGREITLSHYSKIWNHIIIIFTKQSQNWLDSKIYNVWSLSKTIGTRVIKGHYLDYQICPQVSTAHIINLMRCQNYIILLYTIIDF